MKKKSFPLSQAYRLLEPGPVVMVATAQGKRKNVMTMSWHTMLDFFPPLIGCDIDEHSFTSKLLKATKECVIAITTAELLKKVVSVGNTSGRDIDKFKKFKLTAEKALIVKAPLIGECYANFECKVVDMSMYKKYNFLVLKVVKAWINPAMKNPKTIHHHGKGVFEAFGKIIKIPSRMK